MDSSKTHTEHEKEAVKLVLKTVIKLNIADYICTQHIVDKLTIKLALSSGMPNEKKKKTLDKIGKLFQKMAKYQSATSEGVKLYQIKFKETLDFQGMVNKIGAEYYESLTKQKKTNTNFSNKEKESKIIIPEDAPASVVEICNSLQKILKEKGEKDTKIEVIDLSDSAANFGFKMEDFPDFVSFAKAISAARRANNLDHEGKPGEDILNDAIIKNAERHVDDSTPKEKLN